MKTIVDDAKEKAMQGITPLTEVHKLQSARD
jgi:hypothetical protein